MKNFLKGALFVSLAMPLIDNAIALLEQGTQYLCTLIAAKTYDISKSLQETEGTTSSNVIGFQIPTEELEECEDDDE